MKKTSITKVEAQEDQVAHLSILTQRKDILQKKLSGKEPLGEDEKISGVNSDHKEINEEILSIQSNNTQQSIQTLDDDEDDLPPTAYQSLPDDDQKPKDNKGIKIQIKSKKIDEEHEVLARTDAEHQLFIRDLRNEVNSLRSERSLLITSKETSKDLQIRELSSQIMVLLCNILSYEQIKFNQIAQQHTEKKQAVDRDAARQRTAWSTVGSAAKQSWQLWPTIPLLIAFAFTVNKLIEAKDFHSDAELDGDTTQDNILSLFNLFEQLQNRVEVYWPAKNFSIMMGIAVAAFFALLIDSWIHRYQLRQKVTLLEDLSLSNERVVMQQARLLDAINQKVAELQSNDSQKGILISNLQAQRAVDQASLAQMFTALNSIVPNILKGQKDPLTGTPHYVFNTEAKTPDDGFTSLPMSSPLDLPVSLPMSTVPTTLGSSPYLAPTLDEKLSSGNVTKNQLGLAVIPLGTAFTVASVAATKNLSLLGKSPSSTGSSSSSSSSTSSSSSLGSSSSSSSLSFGTKK